MDGFSILGIIAWSLFWTSGVGLSVLTVEAVNHKPLPVTPTVTILSEACAARLPGGGDVAWYNRERGYGYIKSDASGNNILVTWHTVEKSGVHPLQAGNRIGYATTVHDNGRVFVSDLCE